MWLNGKYARYEKDNELEAKKIKRTHLNTYLGHKP
jgi:hypothetical protein